MNDEIIDENLQSKPIPNKVTIHPEGRIGRTQPTFPTIIERIKSNKDGFLEENRATMERFLLAARSGETIVGREKKKIGDDRLMKYLQDLKKLDQFFKKPFEEITSDEMKHFTLALEEGMLISNKGKPFANETQVAIKKLIRKFYKWLEGGNEVVPDKVKYFDTHIDEKLVKVITREQLEAILRNVNSTCQRKMLMNKAVISMLFDLGSRANELLEIRLEHIRIKDGKVWIGTPISKTNVRWDILTFSATYVKDWLNVHEAKDNPKAQLYYGFGYDAMRMMIARASERAGEKITPQTLRRSGATYWCSKVPEARVKRRFGWSPNSRAIGRYLNLSAIEDDSLLEIEKGDKLTQYKEENEMLKLEMDKLRTKVDNLLGEDIEEAKRIVQYVRTMGAVNTG